MNSNFFVITFSKQSNKPKDFFRNKGTHMIQKIVYKIQETNSVQGALWPMHLKPMSIWPSKSETLQTLLQKFLWEVGRSKVGLAPDHPVFCRQPCHKLACFFSEKNPKCCFDSHFLTNVSYTQACLYPKVCANFHMRSQYISRWNDV